MLRAALLDDQGVFLRMDELADPGQLTRRHLPQITACDLPAGKYKWLPDAGNGFGGAFWSIAWLKRREDDQAAVLASQEKERRIAERRAWRKKQRGEFLTAEEQALSTEFERQEGERRARALSTGVRA